ncbi:MAG: zf-HC2 domain-containing protein [Butyrivibrio sp.]|nr:zf-HC2 domain-containing protein [Butyrivibrio sp.]
MTHTAIQKEIPLFLEDELNNAELSEFLDHVENCPECKEELTIQFLVLVGMQKLEDGTTFNLNAELSELLKDAKKRLKIRTTLVKTSIVLRILVVIALFTATALAVTLGY